MTNRKNKIDENFKKLFVSISKAQDIGVTRDTLQAELEKDIRDYVEDVGIINTEELSRYFSSDDRVSNSMKTFEYARAELVKRKEIIKI